MAGRVGAKPHGVDVQALDASRLEPLIGPERMAGVQAVSDAMRSAPGRRTALHVNWSGGPRPAGGLFAAPR